MGPTWLYQPCYQGNFNGGSSMFGFGQVLHSNENEGYTYLHMPGSQLIIVSKQGPIVYHILLTSLNT